MRTVVKALGARLATAALACVVLAGASVGAHAQTKINFATDWKAQAEHGGFYQAVANGYFAKRGLDVTIRMGGPGIDNQQLMAAGAIDMAMASNNFFSLNLVKAGADVTAVAAIFQKDPQILMTHATSPIKSISDMKGKPIMISSSSTSTFWQWLKAKYGFTDDQIRPYTFNMAPFVVDANAIQQGYLSSEPFKVKKEANLDTKVFLMADEGYPSYSAMILAPGKWVRERPEIVKAFVEASIEGWHSYLTGDPSPANALIKKANPDMTDDVIAYGIAKMKEYGIVTSGDAEKLGIGAMTEARWADFFQAMVKVGAYPADLDYKKAFTTQFVNANSSATLKK
jgi:NitT/TauT family transport system substrate-binding protein